MPEGPEIRLAADRVAKVLVGQPVVEVEFGLPDLKHFEDRLAGHRVDAVDTRGKAMLTRFENGLTIYSHNQLYGRWYTTRRPKLPQTGRQLRLALHTETRSALLYSASDIDVLTPVQLRQHPFLSRLGPDILDPALSPRAIVERLGKARFRRRALGALYLDQGFLAGLGNYLRSEILWVAGLSPWSSPESLATDEATRLAKATITLARRSYRTRGVIVPPSLAKALRAAGKDFADFRFHAFGREGLPCYECGTRIERRTMDSRGIFVCATCQSL
jgi:endonuclease-8